MRNHLRSFLVTALTGALVLTSAPPAMAFDQETSDLNHSVPVVFDILVMRPIGLVLTVAGLALYAMPVAPVMLLTRPSDVAKPLGPLVAAPGRFTFVDPIGQHPPQG